jgi:hypothetical protein
MKPEKKKVYLKKISEEVTIGFFTLADDEALIDKYGAKKIEEGLTKFDVEMVLWIFWNQLTSESKRIVSNVKVTEWRGLEEKEISFVDPIEKLKHIISGSDELLAIYNAVIETKNISISVEEDNTKKKEMAVES